MSKGMLDLVDKVSELKPYKSNTASEGSISNTQVMFNGQRIKLSKDSGEKS